MQRPWRVLASPLTPSPRSHMFIDQSSDNQFTGNLVTMKLHVCRALPSLLAKEGRPKAQRICGANPVATEALPAGESTAETTPGLAVRGGA
jgi:hypothetical protein